ncbi:DUF222 domain-containing protein [Ornithinimicrobium sp. W1665]|uniref:HNH endonuclease n=1 Tax=Ornithinimicrobium sp. W1665 TaxID=3416666 RepID=UPI003CF93FBB
MDGGDEDVPVATDGGPPRGAPVSVLRRHGLELASSTPAVLVRVREVSDLLAGPGEPLTQQERAATLAELERLKNVCAAAQAAITVDLHEQAALDRQATEGELGHRRREREGVTLEVSLARRVSPQRSRSLIAMARALHARLPQTLAAFREGRISEWAASLVEKETRDLTEEQAREVDARLAPTLGTCSEGRLSRRAASLAYEADKRGFLQRHARAVEDRYVSIRPAADGMVRLSGLLPLVEGVALHRSLEEHARSARLAGSAGASTDGDGSSAQDGVPTVAQLRADELVRRVTGVDPSREGMPVEIGLVMTDRALFDEGGDPARAPGYGPVPAALARMIAASGSTRGVDVASATAWLRRLLLDPVDSTLAETDGRRRLFSGPLRRFVVARDQECAMPYCHAPVQDVDHVTRARDGGATTAANGQGLCRACNLDKEAEGLRTEVVTAADGTRAVRVRTRYGQTHHSQPPPVLDTLEDLAARWHGQRPPWWSDRSGHDAEHLVEEWDELEGFEHDDGNPGHDDGNPGHDGADLEHDGADVEHDQDFLDDDEEGMDLPA